MSGGSSNAAVAREVAAAVGEQPQNVVEAWVRANGYKQENVPHVLHEYAIFLSLNGDGAHYRDARSWSHMKQGKSPSPEMWFLQLLLLLCESKWEGSVQPSVREEQNPAAYRNLVELVALQRMGAASSAQTKMLRGQLKSDYHFDLRFDYDVSRKIDQLRAEADVALNGGGGLDQDGGGGGPQAGRGRGRRRQRAPAPAPIPAPAPAPAPVQNAQNAHQDLLDFLRDGALDWARDFDLANVANQNENTDPAWEQAFQSIRPPVPAGGAPRAPVAAPAAPMGDFQGPTELPKIRFVVTALPRVQVNPQTGAEETLLDSHGEPQIAGLLCRFLVHDPNLDVMAFLQSVIENAQQRPDRPESRQVGGKGGGGKGANAFIKELFPQYSSLFHSQHPASNSTTYSTYFQAAITFEPQLLQNTTHDALYTELLREANLRSHPLHLSRLLTLERALARATAAGASPGALALWAQPAQKMALFPRASYYYMSSQALSWVGGRFLGLREKKFPHIGSESDFISHVIAGRPLDPFLDRNAHLRAEALRVADRDVRSTWDQARILLEQNWLVERRLLVETRLVQYDTSNAFVHEAAKANLIRKRIDREKPAHYARTMLDVHLIIQHWGFQVWRSQVEQHGDQVDVWLLRNCPERETDSEGLPPGLGPIRDRVAQCERFNELLAKAQRCCLDAFVSLWPTEGDVDSTPIPDTLRAMQKWFRDRPSELQGNLTREFMKWDPELSIFGNSMLRQLKMYACVGLILQPLICMLTEGLFSCYRWSPKELAFNILLHGQFDTGKTYTAITTLIKLTAIDGTVLPFVSQTRAADTTLRHFYDVIFASDEVSQHKVSQKEAEKNPEMTNKDKLKMTDRYIAVNIFTYETAPSGEQIRWTRTIHTDHYVAMVEVTNHEVEAASALASRYHRLTVAQPQLEARKLQNDTEMSQLLTTATREYLNVNQYLSACAYKAIQCYAMVAPYMGLFHDLNNRIMDWLQAQKVISKDVGARGLEIMKPYAIQLVIHNAIHCVFDLPGAPMYRKRFTADAIQLLQPYLYCTTDIVWWCWTSLASGWIREHNSNVVNSVLRMQYANGLSWPEDTTPYKQYEWDVHGKLPWRRRTNPANKNDPLLDLQYWTLTGGLDTICRNIAARSDPHIDALVVRGVLTELRNTFIPVPWGGYVPCPESEMAAWHRAREQPRLATESVHNAEVDRDIREIVVLKRTPGVGQEFPPHFCIKNSDRTRARTEDDMPRMAPPGEITMAAVEFGERGEIHIMPWIASHFIANKIVEALRYATICGTTKPGKILLGMHLPEDQQNLRVEKMTRSELDTFMTEADLASGWTGDGRQWHPESPPEEEAKAMPSRRLGLAFDRVSAMGKVDSQFFTAVPPGPTAMSTAEWQSRSEADTASMGRSRRIIADLDYQSALQQHIRSGRPLDEPVRSPAWIEEQYRQGCVAMGRKTHMDIDYPFECTFELEERKAEWVTDKKVLRFSKVLAESNRRQAEINKPRKPELLAKMAAQKRSAAEAFAASAAAAAAAVIRPVAASTGPNLATANAAVQQRQAATLSMLERFNNAGAE